MKWKLAAIDLDSTTFDNQSRISPENIRAIEKAIERGVHVAVCTGRALGELPDEIRKLKGLRYGILSNGASVVDLLENKRLYANEMPYDKAIEIVKISEEFDCFCEIYYRGQPYTNRSVIGRFAHYHIEEKYFDVLEHSRAVVGNVRTFYEKEHNPAEKLNLFFADLGERRRFVDRLSVFSDTIEVTSSMKSNIEINAAGANKGSGLVHLCGTLGIPVGETLALGDSDNDMTMLSVSGLPIAVANAVDALKRIAAEITVSNCESAVAAVFEKHLLNE